MNEQEIELYKIVKELIEKNAETEREDLDLRESWHIMNGKRMPVGVKDKVLIDHLLKKHKMVVVRGTVYLYENGCYREDKEDAIVRELICDELYSELQNSTYIRRIFEQLKHQPAIIKTMEDMNRQPKHWVNYKNGYYDPIEMRLEPHDPKYLTINQIPRIYEPKKADELLKEEGTHLIDRFLMTALPDEDDIRMLWEYMGYCMVMDNSFQKFLVLEGKGGSGKSVVIKVTDALVGGNPNTVTMTLANLNKRFYATELFGKLLASCADISSEPLETAYVLKLVTGGDALTYEKKGKDPSYFYSYAKLLFSSNSMPIVLDEKTNAYARRLMILQMNNTVQQSEIDRRLDQRLIEDMEYITARAMKGLHELYRRGAFAESENSKAAVAKLEARSDSVQAYINNNLERTEKKHIRRSEMYRAYTQYCQDEGWQACSKHIFFDRMEQKGFTLVQNHVDGMVFRNVDFKRQTGEEFHSAEEEMDHPFTQLSFGEEVLPIE